MALSGDATGYPARLLRLPVVTALLVGLLLAAAPAVVVRATTFCVNTGGTGGCFAAIGAAVGNASDGDTITVASGTYHEHDITISSSILITGFGTLDAGGLGRGFIIQGGADVGITGLTVQGGHHSQGGGGILNNGGLTLTNCLIRNNMAGAAAGIDNFGDLALIGTTISGNTASISGAGGGIFNHGTLTMDNSAIQNNTAFLTITNGSAILGNTVTSGDGGGISNLGTLIVDNSAIGGMGTDGNTASGNGGGISNDSGAQTTLTGSTISGNTAPRSFGGGIFNTGTATLTSSAISGNSAIGGGGMENDGAGTISVTNSTISGNRATALQSGGIGANSTGTVSVISSTIAYNSYAGYASLYGRITVRNTIIFGDCVSAITSGDYNLESGSSCGFTQPHDLKNTNPLLGPLQVNAPGSTATYALLPGSPAVDRGGTSANGCPATDQRGVSRPQGSACDIGAYELIPPRPVPSPRPGPVLGPPPPAPLPVGRPGAPASGGPPAPIPMPRR